MRGRKKESLHVGKIRKSHSVMFDEDRPGIPAITSEDRNLDVEGCNWPYTLPKNEDAHSSGRSSETADEIIAARTPRPTTVQNAEPNADMCQTKFNGPSDIETKNCQDDYINTDDEENVINMENPRNWLEKLTEGKFTPMENKELWATDAKETLQEDNYIMSDEFKKEFENDLPGSCMALVLSNENVPRGWRQAVNTLEWESAMEREISELENKHAWEIVPRPAHDKVLPGVWNFRVKKDENDNIIKYKARWCVDGSREGFLCQPYFHLLRSYQPYVCLLQSQQQEIIRSSRQTSRTHA